jgi:hypothetical protein
VRASNPRGVAYLGCGVLSLFDDTLTEEEVKPTIRLEHMADG